MTTIIATPGEVVPLWLTLEDGDVGRFPQAEIRDEASALVATMNLAHVAGGNYSVLYTVPLAQKYTVTYVVYTDAGHTLLDATHGRASANIIADLPAGDPASIAGAVWNALLTSHGLSGTFGRAVNVIQAISGKSNFRLDTTVYDANGFLLSCRMRVFPSQALALASTDGGSGEGEIFTVSITGTPDVIYPVLPKTVLGLLPP